MPSESSICQVCGRDSSDFLGCKAHLRSKGLKVTWRNFKLALGLDEYGRDPDDPDEMKHSRAEFDGTAHKIHFDAVIGWHCNGCHDHVVDADRMLVTMPGVRQPQQGDWLPADEV